MIYLYIDEFKLNNRIMQEEIKQKMEEILKLLPYNVYDKVYRFTQHEIKEYFIQKIEISLVRVKPHNCLGTIDDFKVKIVVQEKTGVGGEIYDLNEFTEKFSTTPSLAIEKVKKIFLTRMDEILEKYQNIK